MSVAPIQPMPPIMTTIEVAKLLRCLTGTVDRYVHNHELRAIQIGKERRFRAEDVQDFIAARPGNVRSRS